MYPSANGNAADHLSIGRQLHVVVALFQRSTSLIDRTTVVISSVEEDDIVPICSGPNIVNDCALSSSMNSAP